MSNIAPIACTANDETRERVAAIVDALPGASSLPLRDGDRTFDHPWELRALSIAIALSDAGQLRWEDFQSHLIASIERWQEDGADLSQWGYYEHVVDALESVMSESGWSNQSVLDRRTAEVLATPADKDHQHAHREPVASVGAAK